MALREAAATPNAAVPSLPSLSPHLPTLLSIVSLLRELSPAPNVCSFQSQNVKISSVLISRPPRRASMSVDTLEQVCEIVSGMIAIVWEAKRWTEAEQ